MFANKYPVGLAVKFTAGSLKRSKTVRFDGNLPTQSMTPNRIEGAVTESFFAAVTNDGKTVIFSFMHCKTHGSPPKKTCPDIVLTKFEIRVNRRTHTAY